MRAVLSLFAPLSLRLCSAVCPQWPISIAYALYLSVCMCVCLSVSLSVCIMYLSIAICLSVSIYMCNSIYLCPFIFSHIYLIPSRSHLQCLSIGRALPLVHFILVIFFLLIFIYVDGRFTHYVFISRIHINTNCLDKRLISNFASDHYLWEFAGTPCNSYLCRKNPFDIITTSATIRSQY